MMTKDEAIEACGKAMIRRLGQSDANWRDHAIKVNLAEDIVAALEALGLLELSE
jgi:hypothetical protein